MIYSNRELEALSEPPLKYERAQIIRTKDAIQAALDANIPNATIREVFELASFNYDIYLQGSYKNSTNISQSSDIDIVIELTSLFYPDTSLLTESQRRIYDAGRSTSKYKFADFKSEVQKALVKTFGNEVINRRDKCIFFAEHAGYCNADILPCFTYKKFTMFESYSSSRANEGIEFITDAGAVVINYPHQHYESLAVKSKATSGSYKETVRMFKNLKNKLIENRMLGIGVAKSYFVENLLYNVKNATFDGGYTDRFRNVLNELIVAYNNGGVSNYVCANGFQKLLSTDTWNKESLLQFLRGLSYIKNNDEFKVL